MSKMVTITYSFMVIQKHFVDIVDLNMLKFKALFLLVMLQHCIYCIKQISYDFKSIAFTLISQAACKYDTCWTKKKEQKRSAQSQPVCQMDGSTGSKSIERDRNSLFRWVFVSIAVGVNAMANVWFPKMVYLTSYTLP